MNNLLLLAAAGFLAGAMNAVAGGGSFESLPALVFVGVPSVMANASSTVALFPGTLASTWAYRKDLASFGGVSLRALLVVSVVGGFAGALLLLFTPEEIFDEVLPWLLLLATLTFAFGRQVGETLRRHIHIGTLPLFVVQFLLAIYGGYFGGAVGLMMLAAWTLFSSTDLKAMNPARVFLVGATNGVAVVCFIVAGEIRWPETLAMLCGATIGGYAGARVAQRISPGAIRLVILCFSAAITVAFFLRAR